MPRFGQFVQSSIWVESWAGDAAIEPLPAREAPRRADGRVIAGRLHLLATMKRADRASELGPSTSPRTTGGATRLALDAGMGCADLLRHRRVSATARGRPAQPEAVSSRAATEGSPAATRRTDVDR